MTGYNVVKTFSANVSKKRSALGDEVTKWIKENKDLVMVDAVVRQSSDREFHCITIVLFCIKMGEC